MRQFLLCLCLSFWFPVAVKSAEPPESIDLEQVYIVTDRYHYNPSEKMYFSIFVSNEENQLVEGMCRVKVLFYNANNQRQDSQLVTCQNGRGSSAIELPATGGIYTLKAFTSWQLNAAKSATFSKKIYVQSFIDRYFFIEPDYKDDSYAPGSKVSTNTKFKKSDQSPIEKLTVKSKVFADDRVIYSETLMTDEFGETHLTFDLPKDCGPHAYVEYSATFQGKTETQISRIPIKGQVANISIQTACMTEDLLVETANTLVFESIDINGQPITIEGLIKDSIGNIVTTFKSLHEGMGQVQFTPKAGAQYTLFYRIPGTQSYSSIPVPKSSNRSAKIDFIEDGENLKVEMIGALEGKWAYWVGSGKVLKSKKLTGNKAEFRLPLKDIPVGLVTVNLMDGNEVFARRMYVVNPGEVVKIKTEQKVYDLNQKLRYSLDWDREPIEQLFYSTRIVNTQFLNQVKNRNHSVVSWTYLGVEFGREIEDPTYYFDSSEEDAQEAMDILLSVYASSWRRNPMNGLIQARSDIYYPRGMASFSGHIHNHSYYAYREIIQGAKVQIKNTNYKTTTDENGKFSFTMIPAKLLSEKLILVITDGLEKMEYELPQSYNVISSDFQKADLAEKDVGLNQEVVEPEYRIGKNQNVEIKSLIRTDEIRFEGNKPDRLNYSQSGITTIESRSLSSLSIACVSRVFYYLPSSLSYSVENTIHNNYYPPFQVSVTPVSYASIGNYSTPNQLNRATLYFNPLTVTNHSGLQKEPIFSGHYNAGYSIILEGFTEGGYPFISQADIEVTQAIQISSKLPTNLRIGDKCTFDIIVSNKLEKEASPILQFGVGPRVWFDTLTLQGNEVRHINLPFNAPDTATSIYVTVNYKMDSNVRNFSAGAFKVIRIHPRGHLRNEVLSSTESKKMEFEIGTLITNDLTVKMSVMQNFLTMLQSISESMIREPHGCFEQVSSTNYPNILAVKVLQEFPQFKGDINKYQQIILQGYNKLAAYETSQKGFSWYGGTPPHQSLTAYGLLQFHLMKKVGISIDNQMFNRNLEWLWNERDQKGGFNHNAGKYGFRSASYEVCNAYITWVLSRIGEHHLEKQILAIETDLKTNFDAYKLALLGNIYANTGQKDKARESLNELITHFEKTNYKQVQVKQTLVSYGLRYAKQECLALALMLQNHLDPSYNSTSIRLTEELLKGRVSNGFGHTQATALTLEALSPYIKYLIQQNDKTSPYQVVMNGRTIKTFTYNQLQNGSTFSIPRNLINLNDKNTIQVLCNPEASAFMVELNWYEENEVQTASELDFTVKYSAEEVNLTESIFLTANINNLSEKGRSQVVACINTPGGVDFNMEELRYLSKNKIVDYYEVQDGSLYLYFLEMGPNEKKQIKLALIPQIAGTFYTEENLAYEYYNPTNRQTSIPKVLTIKPAIQP